MAGVIKGALLGLLMALLTGCASTRGGPPATTQPVLWPLDYGLREITSEFGSPRSGGRRHQGIDIRAPKNTPVLAAGAGYVSYSGTQRGYGKLVAINHGAGIESLYAHLDRRKVREGERVRQGEVIGQVGKTGNATGYHLHYEVRRHGAPVDPRPYLP